jgi:nucleotide-binding universal stress UspA family protein
MIVLKHILVPTDLGAASEVALRYACTLADTFGADVHLFHVMDNTLFQARFADPTAIEAATWQALNERLEAAEPRGLSMHLVVERFDAPADAIVRYAKSAAIDLIVMGTHGHTGAAHMLIGSVAERVVRTAPCPVLVVRHPEREFIAESNRTKSIPA